MSSIKPHILQIIACLTAVAEGIILICNSFEYNDKIGKYITMSSYGTLVIYSIITVLSICGLIYEINEIVSDYRKYYGRVFLEDDKEGIDAYLTRFIESGESVAILSHDMSWINDNNISMLDRKARRKELLLFLPQETPNVRKLKEIGADVRYFGKIISDPAYALIKSRMTVINWNKAFPKLTYPVKKDGLHINYEVPAGEPANQLALDLIQLLILSSAEEKDEQSTN